MPDDIHPGDDPGELSADDLDAVDGGAFTTEFESGANISSRVESGKNSMTCYNCPAVEPQQ
jgi:hypothetical protein